MATRILECAGASPTAFGLPIVPPILIEQPALTATGSSQASIVVTSPMTRCFCVQSDEQIYVRVGKLPLATTNSYRIAAGGEQYFEAGIGDMVAIRT